MSTVIDMRVYLDPRDSRGAAAFTKCVDAVSHWLGHEPSEQWQDLRLAESMPHNNVTTVPDPMSALELKAAVDSLPGCPEQILKSGIGFPCWRFRPDGPYRGFLRAGVECWDADCKRLRRGKVWIEGNARLVISSVNPFQAALQERPFPNREEINRRVEENIECFLQLVFNVAKFLRPVSIKVFSDTGDLLPFNAYLAFYNTNHGVINDLSNIAEMWKVGIPEYGIPPFEPYAKRHDQAFSELRTPSVRMDAWARLAECVPKAEAVTDEMVAAKLRSNDFDVCRIDEGFVVLNYPYCFNGFLDRFYCALPRASSEMGNN